MGFEVEQYMGAFLAEAEEQLEVLNNNLLRLENAQQGRDDPELIHEMFRAAHSLKGASATLGLMPISRLTHKIEDLMDGFRSNEIQVDPRLMDILFSALDHLDHLVDRHEITSEVDEETQKHIDLIQSCLEKNWLQEAPERPVSEFFPLNGEGAWVREEVRKGKSLWDITVSFDPSTPMKAVTAFLVLNNLGLDGDIIKSIPPPDKVQDEEGYPHLHLLMASDREAAELFQTCNVSYVDKVVIARVNPETGELEPEALPGEPEISPEQPEEAKAVQEDGASPPGAPGSPEDGPRGQPKDKKPAETLRVDTRRLDDLMNTMGELLISQTKFAQLSKNLFESFGSNPLFFEISEEAETLGRITSTLQDGLMKVRMVPVGTVFNRFPRVTRDLAKKAGKEVNLVISGEETELDKSVIELISDPITHLIRNAVDHGIESPEERQARGKPAEGTVHLRAAHEGSQIVIEVEDDGKGIDPRHVLRKAVDKGFITQAEEESLSEQEIYNLLFLPGFSTAERITDISGRGVGMDVVRRNITNLGGIIGVRSTMGEGSVFTIKLPLTLAIIQALLVKAAGEIYAIPLVNVIESFRIRPGDISTIQGRKVFTVRGRVVPIVSLQEYFQLPRREDQTVHQSVVLAGSGEKRLGFQVDELLGQQEVVIKSINTPWMEIEKFSGATILGNGRVILILNMPNIFGQLETGHAV